MIQFGRLKGSVKNVSDDSAMKEIVVFIGVESKYDVYLKAKIIKYL